MIYELRAYEAVPGKLPQLIKRFDEHTISIWRKHGIDALGFWTTVIGKSNNSLTYILRWQSLADREAKWALFQNDPAWHKARDESERDGPLVANIQNQMLAPTSFSALQ
jgi:hypothetical protein